MIAWALGIPAVAQAEPPNIERVTVSRDTHDRLTFRIFFATPVLVDPDDQIQVAIDADRDPGTGVDGLDYSLDEAGPLLGEEHALLPTAVDGKPVASSPPELRFSQQAAGPYGFSTSRVAFSVPASMIGDPDRFDFYVFIRVDGELDEAPSHVLFSAASSPWTYPSAGEPETGQAYPTETYVDGSDVTLSERPGIVIAVIVGLVIGLGALLAIGGCSLERMRKRT